MRRRAYLRLFVAAVVLTLTATTLAPDAIAPFFKYPQESSFARVVETRIYESITWPPQLLARSLGIWIDSHSAQFWPRGWPMFAALALRISLISVPFWFISGVALFELARYGIVLSRRSRSKPG